MSQADPCAEASAGDDRPWERPGAVRRDCEPHRSNVLLWLAGTAFVLGLLSLFLAVPGVVALFLASEVDSLAWRDLRRMRAGRMDLRGVAQARKARRYATAGMVTTLVGWFLWCGGFSCFLGLTAR